MTGQDAINAARIALADAEHAITTWRDDYCASIDRWQRLGEIDLISAEQVKRCLHKAAAAQRIELEREFYKQVRADVVIVQLPRDEIAAFEEWRAQELERRRWLDS